MGGKRQPTMYPTGDHFSNFNYFNFWDITSFTIRTMVNNSKA